MGDNPRVVQKIPPIPPDGVTAQNTTDLEGVLTTDEEAREVVEWLRTLDSVALDIETYGTNLKGGISHATDDATSYLRGVVRLVAFHGSGQGRIVDMHGVSDGMLAEMLRAIEGKPKYLHNALFDLPRLYRRCGVLLKREVYDTLIAARAARAGETESDGHTKLDYDLGAALERELGVKVDKNIKHKWGEPLTPERIGYVANDVAHLEELHKALVERMEWHDVLERYEVIRSTLPTFLEAAVAGVPVDEERLEELTNSARDERDRFLEKLNAVAPEHPEGGKWTWNSQKNTGPTGRGRNGTLRAFSVCGVELGDVQYRTLWDHRNDHPVVAAYLDYKGKKEEYAAYRKWLPEYSEDGRLYPQPKVAGAVTSRLLYSKPNVQGVAKRKMEGYRKAVAPPKGRCIVAGDFEQQELRIAAVISGDRKMQRVFIEGKDVYLATASKMVGEEITDKKHPARAGAKRATLGFAYGMGIDKYIENTYKDHGIHLDKRQAQNDRKAFQKAFPGFHRWQQEYGKADDRETRSILGWRRVVKAWDNGGGTLEPAYNERINGRVQSTAGDILYLALVKMQNDPHPDAQFLMGVHDEVVLEAPEESAEEVALWLHAKMVEAFEEVLGPDLGGEQSVEVGYGPSWGEQQDVELPEDKAA